MVGMWYANLAKIFAQEDNALRPFLIAIVNQQLEDRLDACACTIGDGLGEFTNWFSVLHQPLLKTGPITAHMTDGCRGGEIGRMPHCSQTEHGAAQERLSRRNIRQELDEFFDDCCAFPRFDQVSWLLLADGLVILVVEFQ